MTDREKVLEEFERFLQEYDRDIGFTSYESEVLKGVHALLKAQEPRVLTLAELEHAEVAYAEDIDKDEIIPILVNGRRFDCFTMIRAHLGDGRSHIFHPSIFDYNKRWRCWTSRPTDEQRGAEPWE